jgi:hypothetical protein
MFADASRWKTDGWTNVEGSRNRTVHFGGWSGAKSMERESGPCREPTGSLLIGYLPPSSDDDVGRKVHESAGGAARRIDLRVETERGSRTEGSSESAGWLEQVEQVFGPGRQADAAGDAGKRTPRACVAETGHRAWRGSNRQGREKRRRRTAREWNPATRVGFGTLNLFEGAARTGTRILCAESVEGA